MQRERPLFNSYLFDLFRRPCFESPMPLDSFQTPLRPPLLPPHKPRLWPPHHVHTILSTSEYQGLVAGGYLLLTLSWNNTEGYFSILFLCLIPPAGSVPPAGKKLFHLSATSHIHTPVVSRIMSHSYYFCMSFLNNIFELGKEHRINRLCKWK